MSEMRDPKQSKPRSMYRVLSDIEYDITNESIDRPATINDISLMIAQLETIQDMVAHNKYEEAYNVIHPSIKYYQKDGK